MILLVLAMISSFSVPQGGSFNLSLSEQSYVELDPCMFFEDFKSSGNYSAGDYKVIVSYGCTPGKKEITVSSQRREERILVEVEKVENINQKIVELQKEALSLKSEVKNLSLRIDYFQSLVAVLNDINVQLYDRHRELAERYNKLQLEMEKLKLEYENCSKNVTTLERRLEVLQISIDNSKVEIEHCKSEVASLTSFLSNSTLYLEIFKNLTILALAFVVGMFLAMLRRY